jgi:hypothetical protein
LRFALDKFHTVNIDTLFKDTWLLANNFVDLTRASDRACHKAAALLQCSKEVVVLCWRSHCANWRGHWQLVEASPERRQLVFGSQHPTPNTKKHQQRGLFPTWHLIRTPGAHSLQDTEMSGALILLGACNVSEPLQRFTFNDSDSTVSLTSVLPGQCVTFGGPLGKFPLFLSPCNASDISQQWVYDGADTSIRNPAKGCAGTPGWQCLSWSGIEYGSCTSDPPALGLGCGLSAWPTGGPTTWNNALELDAPAVGMVQALHAHPTGPSPSGLCAVAVPPPPPPVPTPDVLAWSTKEVMCLYDIDICTYIGSQGCNCQDAPPPVDIWSPTALDTDSWLRAGVSAGCAIHILVSKHMCGFVSWNSTAGEDIGYNYSSAYASSPVDVVDAFVRSARAMQQPIGLYYSLTNNARTKTCGGNILPNPSPGQLSVTPLQYDSLVRSHLTELWSRYGELSEVWFDGGFTPSQKAWIPELLASLQPHAVAFNGEGLSPNPTRWIGSESGYAPNETWSTCDYDANGSGGGDPNSGTWFPAETCVINFCRFACTHVCDCGWL